MIGHEELVSHLASRQHFRGASWLESLQDRKREEAEFHNFEREKDDVKIIEEQQRTAIHANKKFYSVTQASTQYVEDWLARHVPGRVCLDYACGNGKQAINAARLGASLSIGLDISDVSIRNARLAASQAGVAERCSFVQGDCEATELPDASVDTILCSGMLHHLDLQCAYPELRRILRPGGRLLAVEALGHNPAIQWYRNRTPHLRTEWEKNHILKWSDVQLARKWFELGEVRYWHLFNLLAVPLRGTALFKPALTALDQLDQWALSTTLLGQMAWQITFELRAPANE